MYFWLTEAKMLMKFKSSRGGGTDITCVYYSKGEKQRQANSHKAVFIIPLYMYCAMNG